jgi:hypothetical protein
MFCVNPVDVWAYHTTDTHRTVLSYIHWSGCRAVVFQSHDKRVDTSIVFMFVEQRSNIITYPTDGNQFEGLETTLNLHPHPASNHTNMVIHSCQPIHAQLYRVQAMNNR